MTKRERNHQLSKSELIADIPLACSDELTAVEFFEKQRWGNTPCCMKCGSVEVYKMADTKTGERNKRFLWRCRDCKEQYTVRIGTVYEESRIELRHWATRSGELARRRRAFRLWRSSGIARSATSRHCS